MKCTKLQKLLMPYAEGSLPKEMTESLEHHLAGCESCAQELRSLTCTVGVLKQVEYPMMEPAADLRSRVLAQISPGPAKKPWWQAARLQAYSPAAAGLLLVAIAGTAMWSMLQRGIEVPAAHQEAVRQETVEPTEQSPVLHAPAAKKGETQPAKAVAEPKKPITNRYKGRPAEKPMSPMMTPAWSFVGDAARNTDWSDRMYAADGGPGAPAAPSSAPESLGYGVMAVDGLEKGAALSDAPTPGRSQELALSPNQSALGENQLRGGAEFDAANQDHTAGPVGPATGGYMGAEFRALASAPGNSLDPGMRASGRVAAGNSPTFFAETTLGLDTSALETKLRDFPSSVTVITDLMTKYREANRPRDEYQMAQRLTKLDPDNSGYWLSRAQAADRVPMRATARSCYQRAIKLGLKGGELAQAQERMKALEKK